MGLINFYCSLKEFRAYLLRSDERALEFKKLKRTRLQFLLMM